MADLRPKVSIVIPTRDRAALLGETIESVLAQSYRNWEAIVVDDNSTDGTVELMRAYEQQDDRIKFSQLAPARSGAPAARNHGVALASGEFVIFLDSDDLLAPDCLAQRVNLMFARPKL